MRIDHNMRLAVRPDGTLGLGYDRLPLGVESVQKGAA